MGEPPAAAMQGLAFPALNLALQLPVDDQGPWALVDGGGEVLGAIGRTTAAGRHATSVAFVGAPSCLEAVPAARARAGEHGGALIAVERPAWLPSTWTATALEGKDGEDAIWVACLDTPKGPLGATSTASGDLGKLGAHVKTALERIEVAVRAAPPDAVPTTTTTPVPPPTNTGPVPPPQPYAG
jgi:hypothetical protein